MADGVLDGKVAIVTGAGSTIGIGRAIVLALAGAGAKVLMMDINESELERSASDARAIAGNDAVLPLAADISQPADADRVVRSAIDHFGALHILVNNAGINLASGGFTLQRRVSFWEVSPEAWARVIAVNVSGTFHMTRAAVRPMLDQHWGRIISVTTSLDTMIRGYGTPYGPSKAAHEAFISAAAEELALTGVTANVLVPGGSTNTNLSGQAATRPQAERDALIQPEVMGPPAVWLASDASGECNGMRFVAIHWDEPLPIALRIQKAGAPVAWPQLGRPADQRGQELGKSAPSRGQA